jgi:hypothetical protein
MLELKWSASEKSAAHAAFESARSRERLAIRRHVEVLLHETIDGNEIWAIRDYLNDKARELDKKYDFRYSVLISVFARLLAEGWLTMEDLRDLDNAKCKLIREHSAAWARTDA